MGKRNTSSIAANHLLAVEGTNPGDEVRTGSHTVFHNRHWVRCCTHRAKVRLSFLLVWKGRTIFSSFATGAHAQWDWLNNEMIFSFKMRCLGAKEPLGKVMDFPGVLLLCMSSTKCEEAPIIFSLWSSRVSHWVMCNSQISSAHPVSITSCILAGSCCQEDILPEPQVYMFSCSANTLTQKAANNLEFQVALLRCSGIWRVHTERNRTPWPSFYGFSACQCYGQRRASILLKSSIGNFLNFYCYSPAALLKVSGG